MIAKESRGPIGLIRRLIVSREIRDANNESLLSDEERDYIDWLTAASETLIPEPKAESVRRRKTDILNALQERRPNAPRRAIYLGRLPLALTALVLAGAVGTASAATGIVDIKAPITEVMESLGITPASSNPAQLESPADAAPAPSELQETPKEVGVSSTAPADSTQNTSDSHETSAPRQENNRPRHEEPERKPTAPSQQSERQQATPVLEDETFGREAPLPAKDDDQAQQQTSGSHGNRPDEKQQASSAGQPSEGALQDDEPAAQKDQATGQQQETPPGHEAEPPGQQHDPANQIGIAEERPAPAAPRTNNAIDQQLTPKRQEGAQAKPQRQTPPGLQKKSQGQQSTPVREGEPPGRSKKPEAKKR